MSVKLGPMTLGFTADVKREEADETARRARLSANAREQRGRGGAGATVESTLTELGSGTRVSVVTDLTLSGAVAQYGSPWSRTSRRSSFPASPTVSESSWRALRPTVGPQRQRRPRPARSPASA